MGIAALILSIVTIVFSFIPFFNIIAIFTGTLSFVFAIVSLIRLQNARKEGWGKSLAAIILCTISMWIIIFSFSYSIALIDKYDYFDDYDYDYDYDYTYNTRKYTNNYDRYNKYNNYNFNKRKYNSTNERIYDIDDMYDVFN